MTTVTIPPYSRTKIAISFPMKDHNNIDLPCIAELRPIELPFFDCPEVVPTLNQLTKAGQTEIMVANNQSHAVTIKTGTSVATSKIEDIIQINKT